MSKFKVGDKVRVKDPDWFQNFDAGTDLLMLSSSDEFDVVGFNTWRDEEFVEVAYSFIRLEFTDDELELVDDGLKEPSQISTDPKTAFLEELRELLGKYEMSIYGGCSGYDSEYAFVEFESKDGRIIFNLKEDGRGNDIPLTADNLMDYDKEEV